MEMDYGGWLSEDLRKLYKDLLYSRDRSEDYSDRAEINQTVLKIMAVLQSRNDIDE